MDKTQKAVAIFNKLADVYEAKFMNVDKYSSSLDLFCESLTPNARVLELACGPGNITRYLLNRRPDLKILGTDLAPNMIALAKNNNPEAAFSLMDCREIGKVSEKYEAIMCGFCLPYLSREETVRLIGNAAAILHPHGFFYLSTMEADYAKSGWEAGSSGDLVFMHYHQEDYLTEALSANGFKITELQRLQYPAKNGMTTDLIMIAKK